MGRGWSALRALLPSWRFFDEIAEPISLIAREPEGEHALPLAAKRPWYALFVNPEGNVALLAYSTLERLLAELAEEEEGDPTQLVSYALVQNWVAQQVTADRYQFELRMGDETLLISPWHTR